MVNPVVNHFRAGFTYVNVHAIRVHVKPLIRNVLNAVTSNDVNVVIHAMHLAMGTIHVQRRSVAKQSNYNVHADV